MGCNSSTGNISLFASLSERFVREAGTEDSLIPLRSIDQSSKLSLMGVVIKRTKKTSKKVVYRPYDFSLTDFLKDNKKPLTIEEKSTKVFTEYNPRRNSSLSGSAGIQAPRELVNLKAEISKNEAFSFTTGTIKMLQLNSNQLVKALISRCVDMNNPVVRQIHVTGGILCVVCKKIVIEENSNLTKNNSGGGNLILGAKQPVANAGGEIKVAYDSSSNVSIGVSAGTTLAYSVWELQVDVKNGAIVPMVIGDTPGGFVGDDVTDNVITKEMTKKDDHFQRMFQVLQPFIDLAVDERDVIVKQLKTIMEDPTDAKILDGIFDYAAEILEYPGNQHPKAPRNIDLRKEGVLNTNVCSLLLQTAGFQRTLDANNKAAVSKKDSPVLYWPDSQTPIFQAFDYLFDIIDQPSETEIKALGHVTSLSGRVLLEICADHYGENRTDAEHRLDIMEDQSAAILSLSMGLNYDQLTSILTFPDRESRSSAAIYTVLYAMYAEK